ncbi:MAG: carboxypeptidase regulatory-like domain-containing protein, partial [Terriglobales bacterium]
NISTGVTRSAPSNASGMYNFALVTPGTYLISATKSGFAKSNSAPTAVEIGETLTLNFSMQPGSETQTVEVTAAAPLVNAQKTGVSGNISTAQVQSLPINGNDYGSLAILIPGVKPVQPYDPTKMRVATFSVDGGTGRNVNVAVDGIEDKDNSVGGPDMQLPLNAIQEFKVSPSRFSAANGRSEGAAINVVEKEGTNKFHGGAQYYFTNTTLNADDYFSKQSDQPTPEFDRQQFGADIGGPVIKNKDFFFFAFFRDNEKTEIPITSSSVAELTSAEAIGAKPTSVIPTPYHDNRYSTRIDHTINSANHLSFTFNWQSNYGLNDQDGNETDATDNNFTKNNMILGGLTWSTIINPTTVNSLTGGYQYWNNLIATNQVTPYAVSFPDGTSFGTNGNVPQNTTEKKWQIRDDFSMNRGNHSIKLGEDTVWDPMLAGFFEYNMVPGISFSDSPVLIAAHGVSTVNPAFTYTDGFSTPGAITSMSLTSGDPFYAATGGTKSYGLYAEDDWQASQRLTVNLGVRYELDENTYGETDMPKNRTYLALQAINSPYGALPKADTGDLAPIIGFTYDLSGHGTQLLRGGFGMYYGQVIQNSPLFALQQTDPTMFGTVFSSGLSEPGGTCLSLPCNVPGSGGIPLSSYALVKDPNPVWTGGATTALGPGSGGQDIDPNFRNPVSEQWNLGYTWGFNPNAALRVDYVHELGLHEMTYQTLNHIINSVAIGDTGAAPVRQYDAAFTAAGLPDIGAISDASSIGRSRYDSLDVELQRRMARNFSMDISYTLARSLAWGGVAADFGT